MVVMAKCGGIPVLVAKVVGESTDAMGCWGYWLMDGLVAMFDGYKMKVTALGRFSSIARWVRC